MPRDIATAPAPSVTPTSFSLHNAVDALKERAVDAYVGFENSGDLAQLVSDLVYLRDRAEALQCAAAQIMGAIENNL